MTFSSPRSLRATSIKHHDRGLTLVFGSDGQVSLIGFDGGIASQPLGVSPTFPASNTGVLTPGTLSTSSESASALPIPNLEATSASLTSTATLTSTSTTTSIASSVASSTSDLSSTATDTDTNLPSIPTVNYPTPTPTAVSNPKDHGVGAPFYLAIVLASISFIGCVAAFIAWWVRSRARRHNLELEDPWNHRDSISGASSPSAHDVDGFEKGIHADTEAQTRPYYLPASIVHRSSSKLLAVPHTIPGSEEGTLQHGIPALVAGRYPFLGHANDPRARNVGSQPNSHPNMPSSQTAHLYSRPDAVRLRTGLSVQESTCTLGRLRVANRVPGDVTSGDEGGMNVPRIPHGDGSSPNANTSEPNAAPVGAYATQHTQLGQSERAIQGGGVPLEPPGPATLSWGRRTDTVAALRRSRRRTPETTVQTYKNARYGGYWYPTLDGVPSSTEGPVVTHQDENDKALTKPPLDPLGWKSSLRSSFWQAVDAVTGNRPSDPEPRAENVGSGSRFTPAPQRVASRRSPVSPATSKYELTLSEEPFATHETPRNESRSDSFSTRSGTLEAIHTNENTIGRVDSMTPKVSHLNRDLGASARRRPLDSLRTETGSVYSTDSAAARANLRKYGYGDPIPSSWSALGATPESDLDLDRARLPLPRPIRSSSPGALSTTPSRLTSELGLRSGSVSTHTRTRSKSDDVGSDDGTLRSGKNAATASHGETATSSMYSMSRNDTVQSERSTVGFGTGVPSQASSTTSSMLSRKKGVTRRKRPRPLARAPSTASSVQSIESGLSFRDVAVRRALLERRKKVKAAGGTAGGGEDTQMGGRDASSSVPV